MSDLVWLLRWLNHGDGRSIGGIRRTVLGRRHPDKAWTCSAHEHRKSQALKSGVDLTYHAHGYGSTPLRALRGLSRVIQDAER